MGTLMSDILKVCPEQKKVGKSVVVVSKVHMSAALGLEERMNMFTGYL